jgi:hypothetical protein
MRLDDREWRPKDDPWPCSSYRKDGTRFWNERGCFCDNGDSKAHSPSCDWYPREQALFVLLGCALADCSSQWERLAHMDPEQFAAAYPNDPNVTLQRQRQNGTAQIDSCHFCGGPGSGAILRVAFPWRPVKELFADEPQRFLGLPLCGDFRCYPAVWRGPVAGLRGIRT